MTAIPLRALSLFFGKTDYLCPADVAAMWAYYIRPLAA